MSESLSLSLIKIPGNNTGEYMLLKSNLNLLAVSTGLPQECCCCADECLDIFPPTLWLVFNLTMYNGEDAPYPGPIGGYYIQESLPSVKYDPSLPFQDYIYARGGGQWLFDSTPGFFTAQPESTEFCVSPPATPYNCNGDSLRTEVLIGCYRGAKRGLRFVSMTEIYNGFNPFSPVGSGITAFNHDIGCEENQVYSNSGDNVWVPEVLIYTFDPRSLYGLPTST